MDVLRRMHMRTPLPCVLPPRRMRDQTKAVRLQASKTQSSAGLNDEQVGVDVCKNATRLRPSVDTALLPVYIHRKVNMQQDKLRSMIGF